MSQAGWSWTGPGSDATAGAGHDSGGSAGAESAGVVAFRPRPELAAYLDSGPEPDPFFGGPDAAATFTRRNRMARGHAIPRLPRTKRPGAAPGA